MKILAILGSPHGLEGATNELLSKVLAGCAEEGAETEIIVLSKKKVLYCTGCANCLMEGNCRTRDDVPEIHKKMEQADGIIFASPVYLGTVTGQMKTFLDRCLPLGHRPHLHGKYGLSVVASAGIFDEQTADYLLSALVAFGLAPVGKICGIAVAPGIFEEEDTVFTHAHRLGQQMVIAIREKHQYPETGELRRSRAFFRDLIIKYQGFFQTDYEYWKEKGWLTLPTPYDGDIPEITSDSISQKDDTDLLDTVRTMFKMMPSGFNPEEAKKLKATFQFEIQCGQETLHWYFKIENQECHGAEGEIEKPTLRVRASAADWIAIAEGNLSGPKAFLSGRLKVEGKIRLMMKFAKLFSQEIEEN